MIVPGKRSASTLKPIRRDNQGTGGVEDSDKSILIAAEPKCVQSLRAALKLLLPKEHTADLRLGLLCCGAGEEEFCHNWLQLIHSGVKHFMMLKAPHMEVYPPRIQEHRFLSRLLPHVLPAFELDELVERIRRGDATRGPDVSACVAAYLEGILLHQLIKNFSHGAKADLTNQVLAPARLLISADSVTRDLKKGWKSLWKRFEGRVVESLQPCHGSLGEELRISCAPVSNWFSDENSTLRFDDLEVLMLLVTRIRTLAGESSTASKWSPHTDQEIRPIPSDWGTLSYRILVADDNAKDWRPVFSYLVEKLKSENKTILSIDFSLDGHTLATGEKNPPRILYAGYDLVILDVFLGERDGRDILATLRRDFPQLPILLWTTSRSEDLAAKATLANGILFKKTVAWNDIIEAVLRWAKTGKALRTGCLPNPFFNHSIKDLFYRNIAIQMHEWCLKQLDSFHALDSEYFRYFTDHGGRHIVKLWEILVQALEPFLQDSRKLLLEENPGERELEILSLYLLVTCHELGMFPMRFGKEIENFSTLPPAYLKDVRSLHAARGMVLLHDKTETKKGKGQFWNDERGQELGKCLRDNRYGDLANRVAVLVGYHARLFKKLDHTSFLDLQVAKGDLDARLKGLDSPAPWLARSDKAFEAAFSDLCAAFPKREAKTQRLRRQCALFRFVDALDITSTRNPAEFLVGTGRLPARQCVENLKRDVCRDVAIRNTIVSVEMLAPPPSLELLKKLVKQTLLLVRKGDPDIQQRTQRAKKFLQIEPQIWNLISKPWNLGLLELPTAEKQLNIIENHSVLLLQKPLEYWLTKLWELLLDSRSNPEFIKPLQTIGILNPKRLEPALTEQGGKEVASVAALCVAGELLDEYKAIVEAELTSDIQLAEWKWPKKWTTSPDGLPTLRKELADQVA